MKYNLVSLFFLIYCLCYGFGQKFGNLGAENPDDTERIERPCGAVYDVNCVRQFFANHAKCKKTFGPAPDPFTRTEDSVYFPRVNLTVSFIPQMVRGLNGRIDEFYINKETDKLVIAIEFRGLSFASNNTYFRIHRRAKEPVTTVGRSGATLSSVLITAVIPNIDDLQLDKGEYVAFVNDALPTFFISPTLVASTDPTVATFLLPALGNPPSDLQDLFLTDAAFYVTTYIQYNICDFGLKIV